MIGKSQVKSRIQNPLLAAALEYAEMGWPVLPVKAFDKSPLNPGGSRCPSIEDNKILAWWDKWPNANIGLATGIAFWVLDVDGDDGDDSLKSLEALYGLLPPTVEVITPRGRHLYFRMPENVNIGNSVGRIGPGLDVRGEGGFVVAPPSIHKSGRKYAWSVDSADNIAVAPEWLLKLVREPDAPKPPMTPEEWQGLLGGVEEGGRNSAIARIIGKLLRHKIDPFVALELCRAWNESRCKPPLPDEEVVRIVGSIAGRELSRRELK